MLWTKVSSTNVRAVVMTAEKNDVLLKRLPGKSAAKIFKLWEITADHGKLLQITG